MDYAVGNTFESVNFCFYSLSSGSRSGSRVRSSIVSRILFIKSGIESCAIVECNKMHDVRYTMHALNIIIRIKLKDYL